MTTTNDTPTTTQPQILTLREKYREEARQHLHKARRTLDTYWRGVHLDNAQWCRKMARMCSEVKKR